MTDGKLQVTGHVSLNNSIIHLVMSDEGTGSRIITAYFPDIEKWDSDFRIRKEK